MRPTHIRDYIMKRFIITTAIVAFLMGGFAFNANAHEIQTASVSMGENENWDKKLDDYKAAVDECVNAYEQSKKDKTVDYKALLGKALKLKAPLQTAKDKGQLSRSQVKRFNDITKELNKVPGAKNADATSRTSTTTMNSASSNGKVTGASNGKTTGADSKVTGVDNKVSADKEVYKFNAKTADSDFEKAVNKCVNAYKNSTNAESISDNVKKLFNHAKDMQKIIEAKENWKQLTPAQQDKITKAIDQLAMIPIK